MRETEMTEAGAARHGGGRAPGARAGAEIPAGGAGAGAGVKSTSVVAAW